MFKAILAIVIGTTLTLAFCELMLQLFWHPPYLNSKYKRNDLLWIQNNVVLNSYGYRDNEINLEKTNNTHRIYILGDSYTYGWYINNPLQSFPKVLEKKLVEKYGQGKFEVINAAKPGFNFASETDRLKNEGLAFSPDLVVYGINIFDFVENEYPPKYSKNKIIKKLKLYWLIIGNLKRTKVAESTNDEIVRTYTTETGKNRISTLIREAKDQSQLIDADLCLVVFPHYNPENPNQVYQYDYYHKTIKDIADSNSVCVIDLIGRFNLVSDKTNLVLNPTDPHPSIYADELAGNYIFEEYDFDNLVKKTPVQLGVKKIAIALNKAIPNYRSMLSIDEPGWVYFDRKNSSDINKININFKGEIEYLGNIFKTADSTLHQGWPGAKYEFYAAPKNKQVIIPQQIDKFSVVGISQVIRYWVIDGDLCSEDILLSQLEIARNEREISVKILPENQISYLKIVLDLSVKQVDLKDGKFIDLTQTEILLSETKAYGEETSVKVENVVLSLPQFIGGEKVANYIWFDNREVEATLKYSKGDDSILLNNLFYKEGGQIEIPVKIREKFTETILPYAEYY